MPEALSQAIVQSWTMPLWPTAAVLIAGVIYMRGWRLVRITRPSELPAWRAICFLGGLSVLWLALASPIDALGQFLLVAHMTQHLALMSIAPPLIILGAPIVPLLRGLPRKLIRDDLAPWMNSKVLLTLEHLATHPVFGWIAMNGAYVCWHIPGAYELALRSNGWHNVEHACFFLGSLAFWWFVLRPWPYRNRWSRWLVLPYLVSADLVNTGLSAFLVFCGRVVYPTYASVPRIFNISAANDQSAAGAEMWVLGSFAFLAPLVITTFQLLSPARRQRYTRSEAAQRNEPLRWPERFDLLRFGLTRVVLRAAYGRIALQTASFLVLAIFVLDGFRGIRLSSMNLAGAVLWNIVRPVNLLLLIFVGNVFCMACPFTLPRELGRRLGFGSLSWPAGLKNKWFGALLIVLFFWAYERFALWDSPRATAWVLLAYVGAAFLIDSIFREANFCKCVCPIGQFNFISSLISPLDLSAKDLKTCEQCSTRDCITGNQRQRGCELRLYVPTKVGNLDCTMCMDCTKACPHDNVQITAEWPSRDLLRDPVRSSIGRLSKRKDIAVLILVVVLSSAVNAALMTSPIQGILGELRRKYAVLDTSLASLFVTLSLYGGLLLISLAVAKILQWLSRQKSVWEVFCRFSLVTLPLGLAMWAAHLSFHLLTSFPSIGSIVRHAYADLLLPISGSHLHHVGPISNPPMICKPMDLMLVPGSKGINLLSLQMLVLDTGALFSLCAGWKAIQQMKMSVTRTAATCFVWGMAGSAFYAFCVWVFTQPMVMRGVAT